MLTAILLTAIPFSTEAQSSKRNPRKAAASQSGGGGPLALLFPGRKTQEEEPPPREKGGAALAPKAAAQPVSVAPLTPSGDLSAVPRRNPRQKRIFVLGDSQGHTEFGPELQKQLLMGGHEVIFHAVKNGTPYYWSGQWNSPVLTRVYAPAAEPEEAGVWEQVSLAPRTIGQYVAAYDPDVFIFQAGTNFELDLAKDAPAQISELIRGCVSEAASRGAKVLWIGPPDARDDVKSADFQEKASTTLKAALASISGTQGSDCFFDSRPVCPMPNGSGGDGEHPAPTAARAWAREAAVWALESVQGFEAGRALSNRKSSPPRALPVSPLIQALTEARPATGYPMKLRLVAKSRVEDPKTMAYTDAFSVFKYELENPDEVMGKLKGLTLTTAAKGDRKPFQVYVLHWTAHNDGKGAATTRVASWKEGSTVKLKLTPLDDHPLRKALGTMRQYNDFDDFDAPIFVASNLLDERRY